MALTPSEWDAIQERAVNPFGSNESNAVNRLTRVVTLGDNAILKDENLESIDYKTIKVLANSYIKDDVYIQFDNDVNIDFTDEGNYYSRTDKGMNRPGTYYLVLHYVYSESIPNPIATFKILKHEEELTKQFLLLCECNVVYNQSGNRYEILSFDTKKVSYVHVQNLRVKPDLIPTENSTSPVTSGGVYSALSNKQDALIFDSTPTKNSTNPVTSGGVYSALSNITPEIVVDPAPTENSTNPVSSGGVYIALSGKQASGTYLTPSSTLDASKLSGTVPSGCYTNTTYSNFVKSGSTAAAGLVPKPPTTAGTTKYLREDGTWEVPPNDNTVYTHPTTAGNKHIPSGGSTGQILVYGGSSGTASWTTPSYLTSSSTLDASKLSGTIPSDCYTNTTYSNFVKSGSTAAAGLVPAPSTTAGTTKFLCEDASWAVPPGTYTHPTTAGNKHIPSGGSSGQILKYSSAGTATWADVSSLATFVKSGSTAAAGLVPKPSTTAGTTKYLREDGTWTVPPNDDTVYTHPTTAGNKHIPSGGSSGQVLVYGGSSGTASWASKNFVPATETANNAKFLRNDNTWQTVTPANIGAADSSHNQASSTINAMTNYSKASASAAIATTDSLNTAIGKLEYKIDSIKEITTAEIDAMFA